MRALDWSAARWHKSSRSSDSNICVEVAFAGSVVGLRDSKSADGPVLTVPATSFADLKAVLS